ncbi:MAG TPA: hypothetical protein VGM77_04900 [Gemmatimonadales bacterium]
MPPNVVAVRAGWRATVDVAREDSIILTLPTGDRQLQRFTRHGVFALDVDSTGRVALQLESLTVTPPQTNASHRPTDASWTSEIGTSQIEAFKVDRGGDDAAALLAVVRNLLPRIPAPGVARQAAWQDSANGTVRVDIFDAQEHRIGSWVAEPAVQRDGGRETPVQVHETFEQIGDGSEGGMKITMTSQGKRSGTYYVSSNGKVVSAQLADSVSMLISVPSRQQVVPTTRFSRTTVRFTAAAHAPA